MDQLVHVILHCVECQNYMADRCSGTYNVNETWDNYCDIYARVNQDTVRPNQGAINQTAAAIYPSTRKSRTVGELLLRNSLERKFLLYPNWGVEMEQFDPNIANSPYYRLAKCSTSGAIVGHIDKSTIDNDPLMNAALNNDTACADVLAEFGQNGI